VFSHESHAGPRDEGKTGGKAETGRLRNTVTIRMSTLRHFKVSGRKSFSDSFAS